MKQAIIAFMFFGILGFARAQYACILVEGDSCKLNSQGTEFRTSPSQYNYKVMGAIPSDCTFVTVLVAQPKIVSGYARVKVVLMKGDTLGIGHMMNKEAWVKKKSLHCFVTYGKHDINDSSISWNEDIDLAGQIRKQKHCKYSADQHAGLLLDRARAKYREEDYEGSTKDITHAIDILPYSENLIIYHWYRAHARTEMGDLYGAVDDFDYIIDHRDYLEACSYDFDINDVLCWKAQNLYLAGEVFKGKSLVNIVIASDPERGFAYYLRGLIKYHLEDVKGGCEDLIKAAELGFEEAREEIQARCIK